MECNSAWQLQPVALILLVEVAADIVALAGPRSDHLEDDAALLLLLDGLRVLAATTGGHRLRTLEVLSDAPLLLDALVRTPSAL